MIRDNSPFGTDVDAYGAAKIECEKLVRASGLEWVILRPALIHGAGSEPWTGRIGRLLRQRRLGDLAERGDGRCNLILVEDVVSAIIAALIRPEAAGHAFNLADPDPVTWNRFLLDFASEIDATPVHRLPGWQWKVEKLAAIPLKVLALVRDKAKMRRLPLPDSITPVSRVFSRRMCGMILPEPMSCSAFPARPISRVCAARRHGLPASDRHHRQAVASGFQ